MRITVAAKPDLPANDRAYVEERIAKLESVVAGWPLLGARVRVTEERNPRIAAPFRAEGEVDVNGTVVRARVDGVSARNAVDELADRLHRQLRRAVDRRDTLHRRPRDPEPGEWRHGMAPARPARPSWLAPADREIVRRKSFALEPMPALQALADLLDLDHDFYLFKEIASGADAVVYRRDDGAFAMILPAGADAGEPIDGLVVERSRYSAPLSRESARAEMDEVDHRFLAFVDADSGRTNILYLRHDGHYGLLEPAT